MGCIPIALMKIGAASWSCRYLLSLAEIRQLARVNTSRTPPTALRAVGT